MSGLQQASEATEDCTDLRLQLVVGRSNQLYFIHSIIHSETLNASKDWMLNIRRLVIVLSLSFPWNVVSSELSLPSSRASAAALPC